MECFIKYGDGIVVSSDEIEKITKKIMGVIKTELHEEAQCITVIDSILEDVKRKIHCKQIHL